MIKEKPILFNTEMVRALLRKIKPKTNTRRTRGLDVINESPDDWMLSGTSDDVKGKYKVLFVRKGISYKSEALSCPYGSVGDRLYVRETFCLGKVDAVIGDYGVETGELYISQCEGEDTVIPKEGALANDICIDEVIWKPSIFMPKKDSRINLEITDIRVERVQDITEAEAKAEGAIKAYTDREGFPATGKDSSGEEIGTYRQGFEFLWNSINATPKPCYVKVDGKKVITHYESYPWEDIQETREYRGKPWYVYGNPWVWVVEFKLMEGK